MKKIYVDGFRVRNLFGDMDFNIIHGGISLNHPWYVPTDEIWIEKRVRNETSFLIQTELLEKKYYKPGNYWKIRRYLNSRLTKKTKRNFTLKKYEKSGIMIREVDGEIVRRALDYGFVSGGHSKIYPSYIPKG